MRQVLRAGALGRPRGIGWRGRWEGGSGWGTHVNPWLIHVNVWQKPLQYCKVISFQLIKINEKIKIKKIKTKKLYCQKKIKKGLQKYQAFFQKRHIDDQQTHEKMLNVILITMFMFLRSVVSAVSTNVETKSAVTSD